MMISTSSTPSRADDPQASPRTPVPLPEAEFPSPLQAVQLSLGRSPAHSQRDSSPSTISDDTVVGDDEAMHDDDRDEEDEDEDEGEEEEEEEEGEVEEEEVEGEEMKVEEQHHNDNTSESSSGEWLEISVYQADILENGYKGKLPWWFLSKEKLEARGFYFKLDDPDVEQVLLEHGIQIIVVGWEN